MSEFEHVIVDFEKGFTIASSRAFADRVENFMGQNGVARLVRKLIDLVVALKRRELELLEANNRYLNRARDAELAYKESQRANVLLATRLRETLVEMERRAA